VQPLMMQPATGSGVQSDFFKFSTRLTMPAEEVGRA